MTRSGGKRGAAFAAPGADPGGVAVTTAATSGFCTGRRRGRRAQDVCLPARHSGASTDQISSSCRFPRYR
jgi:hypothetical protein